jgi:hypothetical protein
MLRKLESGNGWIRVKEFNKFPSLKKLLPKMTSADTVEAICQCPELELRRVKNWGVEVRRVDIDMSTERSRNNYLKEVKEIAKEKKKNQLPNYRATQQVFIHSGLKSLRSSMSAIICDIDNSPTLRAVGLDVEYASIVKGGPKLPALLSLCTPNRVDLIRLCKLRNHGYIAHQLPPQLLELLANAGVYKVGSGIELDARQLLGVWSGSPQQNDSNPTPPVKIAGIFDIEQLLSSEDLKACEHIDLKSITSVVLGKYLVKLKTKSGSKKECLKSHWRADKLTDQMIKYAAEDVASALDVFHTKMKLYENKLPEAAQVIALEASVKIAAPPTTGEKAATGLYDDFLS